MYPALFRLLALLLFFFFAFLLFNLTFPFFPTPQSTNRAFLPHIATQSHKPAVRDIFPIFGELLKIFPDDVDGFFCPGRDQTNHVNFQEILEFRWKSKMAEGRRSPRGRRKRYRTRAMSAAIWIERNKSQHETYVLSFLCIRFDIGTTVVNCYSNEFFFLEDDNGRRGILATN